MLIWTKLYICKIQMLVTVGLPPRFRQRVGRAGMVERHELRGTERGQESKFADMHDIENTKREHDCGAATSSNCISRP